MRKGLTISFWNIEVWAVQKHVNLVDLVKSFPKNVFAKFGVDTAENEPHKVWSFGWTIRVRFDIEPFQLRYAPSASIRGLWYPRCASTGTNTSMLGREPSASSQDGPFFLFEEEENSRLLEFWRHSWLRRKRITSGFADLELCRRAASTQSYVRSSN